MGSSCCGSRWDLFEHEMDWHAGSDLDRITYRLVVAKLVFFFF